MCGWAHITGRLINLKLGFITHIKTHLTHYRPSNYEHFQTTVVYNAASDHTVLLSLFFQGDTLSALIQSHLSFALLFLKFKSLISNKLCVSNMLYWMLICYCQT